jgi:hypothetical protein
MEREYLSATAVLRLTTHDGSGVSVQEGLCLGRHAVWTHAWLPGIVKVDTVAESILALREILERGLNSDGITAMVDLRTRTDLAMRRAISDALG